MVDARGARAMDNLAGVGEIRAMPRAVALLFCLAVACSDPVSQGATQVKMLDNAYNAPVVRIPVGAGVAFTNAGRNPHNIVPVDPAAWPTVDTSAVAPGGKLAFTLADAGVYEYYCSYHGTKDGFGMAGAVVVGDAEYTGGKRGQLQPVAAASGTVRRVPEQHANIQAAVDAARPGDLILVAPGIYKEEVTVTTPSLVIRGLDRNTTIVDGEFLRPNGFNVLADGVAIENFTARHATLNGFFWTGVTGFRGRYLTAYNNGDYGIYAFDSKDGLFEDSYASGSPDAGFYIGQCFPCNTMIRRVTSEHNALGYSGTNAGGALYIVNSVWRDNRGGLVPNTLDTELYPPQRSTTIRRNLIVGNSSRSTPSKGLTALAWGNGILLGGGRENVVEDNVIAGHANHGVLVVPLADANFWPAKGNRVRGNRITASGRADVSVGGPASEGNCVDAQLNDVSLAPASLHCNEGRGGGEENDLTPTLALGLRMWRLGGAEYPDWRTQPVPPPQPTMPAPERAPAVPAVGEFDRVRADTLGDPMPAAWDSVFAASATQALPGPAPRLARVQALFPLTLLRLAAFAILVVAASVMHRRARRGGRPTQGTRLALRALLAVGAIWIGLALSVASLFSAT